MSDYNFKEQTRKFVEYNKFVNPTAIQKEVIPFAMKGRDIIGISATGTGKTHAFLIPILEKIDINNILLAKIIYLINQISQNYKSCSFGLVSKYIKEYDELMILKEKLSENKEKEEIIKIIRGGY